MTSRLSSTRTSAFLFFEGKVHWSSPQNSPRNCTPDGGLHMIQARTVKLNPLVLCTYLSTSERRVRKNSNAFILGAAPKTP